MILDKLDVWVKFLEFGVLGFSAMAILLIAFIIYTEQKRSESPRKGIIHLAIIFAVFCITSICINGYVQLGSLPDDPKSLSKLFLKEDKNIREINPEIVAVSLNPTTPNKVWAQVYRYRATIRALLRKLSINSGIAIEVHESMKKMALQLKAKGIIEKKLKSDIDAIAWATFTTQWGAGTPPTQREIEFVFSQSPTVIQKLRELSGTNF